MSFSPPAELPEDAPKLGSIFADRYRIEGVLGAGGMGYVLCATHIHLHQKVAIKMLYPELTRSQNTVERFLREGRAAVRIRSEHVARVLDVGELANRVPYLVMEFLDGEDLAAVLERQRTVPWRTAVDWVLEACEAISEAHKLNIVHRDLKPANLFLARMPNGNGLIKVLDFGISKLTGDGPSSLSMTKSSSMLGSPLYMSPEQLKNARSVDERADQWALGVILYELIAGKPPYLCDTLAELGALVLSPIPAPALIESVPDVPRELSDIINTCLQKKAEDRFVNLADFATAIAPFGGPNAALSCNRIVETMGMPGVRAPISSSQVIPGSLSSSRLPVSNDGPTVWDGNLSGTASGMTAGTTTAGGRRRTTRIVMLAAIACVALAGIAAVSVIQIRGRRVDPTPPAVAAHDAVTASVSAAAALPPPAEPPPRPTPSAEPALTTTATTLPATAPKPKPAVAPPRTAARPATPPSPSPPPHPSPPPKPTTPSGIATSSKD